MYGTSVQQTPSVPQYVTKLNNILEEAIAEVRKHVSMHQDRQLHVYNKRIHGQPYSSGDLVKLLKQSLKNLNKINVIAIPHVLHMLIFSVHYLE